MSNASPVSVALHEAFERDFLPLLASIGCSPVKPARVKPGLVVAIAAAPLASNLDSGRRIEATLWCDGGVGSTLRFRFDVVEPINGVECSRQIALVLPWPDPRHPTPRSLELAVAEFLPQESPERLSMAISFLAGGFAANAGLVAREVPEIAAAVAAAAKGEAWTAAAARAADLWKNRHRRGEVEERSVTAKIVFVGAQLLLLDADGVRLTFRFDTKSFDRSLPLTVSHWYTTAAGTKAASRVTSGETTMIFDERGQRVEG